MFRQPMRMYPLASFTILPVVMALVAGRAGAADDSAKRTTPMPGGQRAEITLNVPLDAVLFVDGQRIVSSGTTRRFVTPPLAPDRRYFYDVKVTWMEGSRARESSRHVSFRAGQRVALNYSRPNGMEFGQDLYLDPAAPNLDALPPAARRADYHEDMLNQPYYPNKPYIFPGSRIYPR